MAPINKLFLLILILAVVALGAVGLRGLLTAPVWAQAAPGGGPPAEAGHGEPGHDEASHQQQAPPAGGPRLPDPEEALQAATSPDLATRQRGLQQLGILYAATTDETLLKKIEDVLRSAAPEGETAGIRQAAVNAMGSKSARNGPALLRATYDRDPEVQTAAINSLTQAPASPEIDARLQALSKAPDPATATAAIRSLMQRYGNLGVAGVPPLVKALGMEQADANANAALQLIRIGRPAIPACMQALASSPNANERHGAALVIGMLCGGKSARQQAFAEAAQADLWRKSHNIEEELKDPDLRALPVLAKALLHDTDELTREMCAQALGYLGSERAAPALAQAATADVTASVRAAAASALIMVPGTAAVPALQQVVQVDKSAWVRRSAVDALGWTGDPRAIGALMGATKDPNEEVRRLAALQLGRLKAEEAISSLTDLFSDSNEDVRWAAVRAVDGLRNRQAVPALVQAAQDHSVLVRHAAETALQKLGEVHRANANLKQ